MRQGSKRFSREVHGDRLGQTAYKPLREEDVKKVTCGFSSLFQGDHLGVEFALESHTALLQDEGLLREGQTVLGHHPFPRGPIWQRLVIDDYFAISCEAASSDPLASASVGLLQRAEDAYSREEVFGSDDKTVRGAESFKVIGAEILSDQKARDSGLVSVGAPLSKRLPMAALSFPCCNPASDIQDFGISSGWQLGLCHDVQEVPELYSVPDLCTREQD